MGQVERREWSQVLEVMIENRVQEFEADACSGILI
jgi:hypothetical protein